MGPQSEADAREYIANREQRRRNRSKSSDAPRRKRTKSPSSPTIEGKSDIPSPVLESSSSQEGDLIGDTGYRGSPRTSLQVNTFDKNLLTPPASDAGASSDSGKEDESRNRKIFSAIIKPRTRYDAEVITKLVVYSGESGCIKQTSRMLT